jgi:DNA-binding protein YbaB
VRAGEDRVVERPEWNVLTDMVGDLRRAIGGIDDVQTRVLQVTGTAWSADRTVKAVVGPRGHLVELEIDPRVYRKPNSTALAATIVATVRAAIEQASARSQEIMDELLPSDMRIARVGRYDLRELNRTHDADLRVKEPDDGELP